MSPRRLRGSRLFRRAIDILSVVTIPGWLLHYLYLYYRRGASPDSTLGRTIPLDFHAEVRFVSALDYAVFFSFPLLFVVLWAIAQWLKSRG